MPGFTAWLRQHRWLPDAHYRKGLLAHNGNGAVGWLIPQPWVVEEKGDAVRLDDVIGGRWVEAIQKDGITWPQVSDLKYWNSEVVKKYNIQGIPYTVLVDREGKILAKNLRGEDLEKKLSEVLQ